MGHFETKPPEERQTKASSPSNTLTSQTLFDLNVVPDEKEEQDQ